MKKIVISGSASLQNEINALRAELATKYEILDFPKPIAEKEFTKIYPQVLKNFMRNIAETDVLLVANFDKKGISGYIGAQAYAELCFGLSQNLLYGKNIELYILKIPEKSVQCYDEIALWLQFGWIKIWNE